VILDTGVQSSWQKKLLVSRDALEQDRVIFWVTQPVFDLSHTQSTGEPSGATLNLRLTGF
jgi:hypothetical protein